MSKQRSDGVRIHLLVPGLLGPFPRAAGTDRSWPSLPHLATLLSRADCLPAALGIDGLLFSLFGYPQPADGDYPSGAVSRLADGYGPDEGFWLHAAPVFLRPDRDRVLLFDSAALEVSRREAEALASSIAEFFAEDGWTLQLGSPDRWYLGLAEAPRLLTKPLDEAVGRNMEPYLPRGPDAQEWRARLNEVQMLLHTHEVNEQREARGALPINGVWVWGGGPLPVPAPAPFRSVYAEDCLTVGLARLGGAPARSVPGGLEELLSDGPEGELLVVIDRLQRSILDADVDAWELLAGELEERWFGPLRWAIRKGRAAELTLYPGEGPAYRIDRSRLRRFLRRTRPLQGFFVPATTGPELRSDT